MSHIDIIIRVMTQHIHMSYEITDKIRRKKICLSHSFCITSYNYEYDKKVK